MKILLWKEESYFTPGHVGTLVIVGEWYRDEAEITHKPDDFHRTYVFRWTERVGRKYKLLKRKAIPTQPEEASL